jgi:hypothetical protein
MMLREPFDPWRTLAAHPTFTDRRNLPWMRDHWMGERVMIRYRRQRGHARRRTLIGYAWGTLTPATRPDQIAVLTKNGHKDIHYGRVLQVWNLQRRKPEAP